MTHAVKVGDIIAAVNVLFDKHGVRDFNWHTHTPINPGMFGSETSMRRVVNGALSRHVRNIELYKGVNSEEARIVLISDGSQAEWLGLIEQSYIPFVVKHQDSPHADSEGKVVVLTQSGAADLAVAEIAQAQSEPDTDDVDFPVADEVPVTGAVETTVTKEADQPEASTTEDKVGEEHVGTENETSGAENDTATSEDTARGTQVPVVILDDAGFFAEDDSTDARPSSTED